MKILWANKGKESFLMSIDGNDYTVNYSTKLQKIEESPRCDRCKRNISHFELTSFSGLISGNASLSAFFDSGLSISTRIDKNKGKSIENLRILCPICFDTEGIEARDRVFQDNIYGYNN